jgi:very-short-patch-repair endonuclease
MSAGRTESPIEARLLPFLAEMFPLALARPEAVKDGETGLVVQCPIGRFRADFAVVRRIRGTVRLVAVECDGRAYHDKARDALRDAELGGDERVVKIVRLPGTLIQVDPREAAFLVVEAAIRAFGVVERWGPREETDGQSRDA